MLNFLHIFNIFTSVFDKPFWEYSILRKWYRGQNGKIRNFICPSVDHPCMYSFGQSLVWQASIDGQMISSDKAADIMRSSNDAAKAKISWAWQQVQHPEEIYVWKFVDLKKPPCHIYIYNEDRLKKFQDASQHMKSLLAQHKEDRGWVGWKLSTMNAIRELSSLSPKKEAEAILEYYEQCGLAADPERQLTHLGHVTTQNIFLQYERRNTCQNIILGKEKYCGLPKQNRNMSV